MATQSQNWLLRPVGCFSRRSSRSTQKKELATAFLYKPQEVHALFDFVDPSFIFISAADPSSTLCSRRARPHPSSQAEPVEGDDHSLPTYLHPSFCLNACIGLEPEAICRRKACLLAINLSKRTFTVWKKKFAQRHAQIPKTR